MANVTPAEELDAALGVELLRGMWRIRAFEERVGQLTRADEVHGLVHLSVGQEAVAVGVCGQLSSDDGVYGNHRAHGHAIAKGAPLTHRLRGHYEGDPQRYREATSPGRMAATRPDPPARAARARRGLAR